jgi:hypothetical protein
MFKEYAFSSQSTASAGIGAGSGSNLKMNHKVFSKQIIKLVLLMIW